MRFDAVIGVGLALAGCSFPTWSRGDFGDTGTPPGSWSAINLRGATADAVFVHERSHTIEHVTIDPFAVERTLELPLSQEHQAAWLGNGGQYFLTAADGNLQVVAANGAAGPPNPVTVPGNIQALGLSPSKSTAALIDDQQNIILMVFDGTGKVTGSWTTSAQVTSGEYVLAGAILGDGQLALTLSGTSIALVDIVQSVQAQAWKSTTSAVTGATNMSWIAEIPGASVDSAMILDGERLLTVDLTTGTIIAQQALGSATVLGMFRDLIPHVIVQQVAEVSTGKNDIFYSGADGKILQQSFNGTGDQITATWLDEPAGTLAVAYDPNLDPDPNFAAWSALYDQREVHRIKLADGSDIDVTTNDDSVDLAVRTDYLINLYQSALGRVERWTYGSTPSVDVLSNFDLGLAQKEFKQ